MSVGWKEPTYRLHFCLIHVDIIDCKIWIQRDGTEDGIAYDLEEAGVPKSDIVLAFHSESVRPHTGYEVARILILLSHAGLSPNFRELSQ